MSRSESDADDSTDTEPTYTTECGHTNPDATITVPGVGPLCRGCYTPIHPRHWPDTLSSQTYRNYDGRVTHSIWLVGLDEYGRGVYYHSDQARLLTVVPPTHRDFRADLPADLSVRELHGQLLYHLPPKHAPTTKPCTLDTSQSHSLLVIDSISIHDRNLPHDSELTHHVLETATNEGWQYISDPMTDRLEDIVSRYEHDRRSNPRCDYHAARWLVEYGQARFPDA